MVQTHDIMIRDVLPLTRTPASKMASTLILTIRVLELEFHWGSVKLASSHTEYIDFD